MKWFLLWALGGTGVVIVAMCLLFLLLRGRIRRRHRVDHKVATGAPITWLVDPRSPARLHRRLARIGTAADAVAADHQPKRRVRDVGRRTDPAPLAEASASLKARAVAADRQLARLATLAPQARRAPLQELARQVAELEEAATRLAALSAGSLTPRELHHAVDHDVTGQLGRLAEAQAELDALDADAGLRPAHPNALGSALPPPPPPPAPLEAPTADTSPPTTESPTRSQPPTKVAGAGGSSGHR